MRRFLMLTFAGSAGLLSQGCLFNQYSPDPLTRTDQLLVQSENERQISKEWRRIWFNDQPSHLGTERVDGGIAPR